MVLRSPFEVLKGDADFEAKHFGVCSFVLFVCIAVFLQQFFAAVVLLSL